MQLGRLIAQFMRLEASAGIALFIMAVLALIVDNSPASIYYHQFFHTLITVQFGTHALSKPVLLWINDGFMTLFFLLVGLEIKRELFEGELNTFSKAILPAIAALGGMIVPALIYIGFNLGDKDALRGWAIPTATDIAFALGILSLLGKRIPPALKIFLMALAIFDDIGAIIVIAIFYANNISLTLLCIATALAALLFLMNRLRVTSYLPYFFVGAILWLCVLKSGVHATLSGIVLACAIPLRDRAKPNYLPAKELIKILHPWVAFGILPLFAFANAGISFQKISLQHLIGPVSIGIIIGLSVGKQVGIWGMSLLAIRLKIAKMPKNSSPLGLYGVALLGGVGFTMSLFIGSLAFEFAPDPSLCAAMVRAGVLLGSLISGILGYWVLRHLYSKR